jgi:hypothetical protein
MTSRFTLYTPAIRHIHVNISVDLFGHHILKNVLFPNHIVYGLRYDYVDTATAAATAA